MVVALAASTAFMMPISPARNALAVTPGDDSFTDFVRVGVPSVAIVMVIAALLVRWRLLP
jgi:di/tricarboxylate transporter